MDKGFVFATVSEGDLQRPDFFRMIGCKVHLGRPKKTATTFSHIVVLDLPKERTSFEVLNRLQEIGVGIIASHPIPGAIPLVPLFQANQRKSLALIVRPEEEWGDLLKLEPSFIIFKSAIPREVECFLEWTRENQMLTPVILQIAHDNNKVGIWIDAPHSLEVRREMSFNFVKT